MQNHLRREEITNEKAKELGCEDTYFITPNGLDAENEGGMHRTTAADLAKIMSYCIMDSPCRERFLEITKETSHSFSNIEGTRRYSCNNKNAYLSMNQDAISGKTGYTSDAGYCLTATGKKNGMRLITVVMNVDNTNNRSKDTIAMMDYGFNMYSLDKVVNKKDVLGNMKINLGKKEYENIVSTSDITVLNNNQKDI